MGRRRAGESVESLSQTHWRLFGGSRLTMAGPYRTTEPTSGRPGVHRMPRRCAVFLKTMSCQLSSGGPAFEARTSQRDNLDPRKCLNLAMVEGWVEPESSSWPTRHEIDLSRASAEVQLVERAFHQAELSRIQPPEELGRPVPGCGAPIWPVTSLGIAAVMPPTGHGPDLGRPSASPAEAR